MLRIGALVSMLLMLPLAAFGQQGRPDLNAFLNRKVTSVQGLVNQAKSDSAVMDRYQRHYAMSREEVLTYLSTLHPARLQTSGVYQVYSVPDEGFVKVHAEKLNKGTLVFADAAGAPALLLKCGNPLSRGPKNPEILNEVDTQTVPEDEDELREIMNEEELSPEAGEPLLVLMEPNTPEYVVMPSVEPTTGGESPIPILPAAVGGLNILPLLFLGGAGLINFDDDGGGTPPPVPEPATLLIVGGGLAALAARKRAAKA